MARGRQDNAGAWRMTKLEELKAAYDVAYDAVFDAYEARGDAEDAADAASEAWYDYLTELNKSKENN
jgi:hypothetical protein